MNFCQLDISKAFGENLSLFLQFSGIVNLKKKLLSMVLFNKEYTYLENTTNLLLFLSLKTHTFTDYTRCLLVFLSFLPILENM